RVALPAERHSRKIGARKDPGHGVGDSFRTLQTGRVARARGRAGPHARETRRQDTGRRTTECGGRRGRPASERRACVGSSPRIRVLTALGSGRMARGIAVVASGALLLLAWANPVFADGVAPPVMAAQTPPVQNKAPRVRGDGGAVPQPAPESERPEAT